MWTCPYCQQQIELTWKRYFSEPALKHRCPHCGKISRVNGETSLKLWTARTCGVLLGAVPLGIIGFQHGEWVGILGGAIGGAVTGLPVDKHLDGKYRQLVSTGDQN